MSTNGNTNYEEGQNVMYDPAVIQEIHNRHELRVRDVQNEVSSKFLDLKCFARDLWKAQKFENIIFGRVKLPLELINRSMGKFKLPKSIKNAEIATTPSSDLLISFVHNRFGRVIITASLNEILFGKEKAAVRIVLKKWEMPETSWFVRNMVKLGLLKTGLEISALNHVMPALKFSRGANDNEYEVDFTDVMQSLLNESEISLDMIRLLNWEILDQNLLVQISINTEKMVAYLKRRMPVLFD